MSKTFRNMIETAQSAFQWLADRVWKVEHAFERANAFEARARATRTRIFFILVAIAFLFAVLAIFSIRAGLSNAKDQIAVVKGMTDARAPLVDRNGALLASDVNNYDMFVDFSDMPSRDRATVKRVLISLFPELKDKIEDIYMARKRMILTKWISEAQRMRIFSYSLPGLSFEVKRRREYPLGVTGAFFIGYTERGGKGLAEAEQAFNDRIMAQAESDTPVVLSMDLRIQGALETEVRAMAEDQQALGAVGIVTNVRTGEVLALTSWPEFDPDRTSAYSPNEMRNRTSADRYEVGSIFKVLTVAIGLDTGAATMNSMFDASQPLRIGDRVIHDFHAQNRIMSLEDVFIKSSNIGTSLLAMNIGIEPTRAYYEKLGLLKPVDIELRGPAAPIYEKKAWTKSDISSMSFGQGIAITPLSYAQAVGATLNGGYLRPLTILKRDPSQALPGKQVMRPETSETTLMLMRANVVKGSGGRANAPGLRVGGKTGSAEKPARGGIDRKNLISSFAAVFPTDGNVGDDRYLVLIMFDSPQGSKATDGSRLGGFVAAPVAGRVINRIAPFLGVSRKDDRFTPANWDKAPVVNDEQTVGR